MAQTEIVNMGDANMGGAVSGSATDTGLSPQQRNFTSKQHIVNQLNIHKDQVLAGAQALQTRTNALIKKFYDDQYDQLWADLGVDIGQVLTVGLVKPLRSFACFNAVGLGIQDIIKFCNENSQKSDLQKGVDERFQKIFENI